MNAYMKFSRHRTMDELLVMDDNQLRAIKIKYSEAKGGTLEHRVMIACDRILLCHEGIVL